MHQTLSPKAPLCRIALATAAEREQIYELRHEVYAREIAQHATRPEGQLRDALDEANIYLVARQGALLCGFISITPPQAGVYAFEKYGVDFPVDQSLYEIRLLTVRKSQRGSQVAMLLMYAAFRWTQSHGATRVVALGRREVLALYLKFGMERVGPVIRSGAVVYELLEASVPTLNRHVLSRAAFFERLGRHVDWQLNVTFRTPAPCFHGGSFFEAIGNGFEHLERSESIINADVLDAWFPPAPGVLAALERFLPWLTRTSPPADCAGLIEALARARSIPANSILPGAGSSDLIFRALRHWLTPQSKVLVLDPTYGEYVHVLEKVIGCQVERLALHRHEHYDIDPQRLHRELLRGYDLVVLVNPNSPTGRHLKRDQLEALLQDLPPATRVWIDETYIEYAGPDQSLESFAAHSGNVIVCKSMSKVYALSGLRVAYLCAAPHQLEALRATTPPWVVSLPAQVAAVEALKDPAYYQARYAQTHQLRAELAAGLEALGWDITPSMASFLLCHLDPAGPTAAQFVARCRLKHLFLRDVAAMGSNLGPHVLRIAVKDAHTNRRVAEIMNYEL